MARASRSTVAIPRPAPPADLPRRVRRWLVRTLPDLCQVVARAADAPDEDARRHFSAVQHACLLLYHALSRSPSLRQTYARLSANRVFARAAGLTRPAPEDERLTVSYSQFALSNTTRPPAFLAGVVAVLLEQLRRSHRLLLPYPLELVIQDSTFLRLSMRLCPWLPERARRGKQGVLVQVQYRPALDLPEHVLVTDTRRNDVRGLDLSLLDDPDRLAALGGQTLVLDLGYYSHTRFVRLRSAQVHWVSRLQPQAHYVVEPDGERPVQAALLPTVRGRIQLVREARITLGSTNNRHGAVLTGLRLVEADVAPTAVAARQGKGVQRYTLLTDRWDLSAAEVVQAYVWRWQIELLFRWLKSQLQLDRPLGWSRNAVHLSVWLALLAHLLVLQLVAVLGRQRRSPELAALLASVLTTLDVLTLTPATPPAAQLRFSGPDWEPPPCDSL